MELYQAYTDYEGMMELTESPCSVTSLRKYAAATKISYNGVEIDLGQAICTSDNERCDQEIYRN